MDGSGNLFTILYINLIDLKVFNIIFVVFFVVRRKLHCLEIFIHIEFHKIFTYFSIDQLKRLFKKIENDGCVVVGVYNKSKADRTKWYSVNDSIMKNE